jgi:hypothetical protein
LPEIYFVVAVCGSSLDWPDYTFGAYVKQKQIVVEVGARASWAQHVAPLQS